MLNIINYSNDYYSNFRCFAQSGSWPAVMAEPEEIPAWEFVPSEAQLAMPGAPASPGRISDEVTNTGELTSKFVENYLPNRIYVKDTVHAHFIIKFSNPLCRGSKRQAWRSRSALAVVARILQPIPKPNSEDEAAAAAGAQLINVGPSKSRSSPLSLHQRKKSVSPKASLQSVFPLIHNPLQYLMGHNMGMLHTDGKSQCSICCKLIGAGTEDAFTCSDQRSQECRKQSKMCGECFRKAGTTPSAPLLGNGEGESSLLVP